MQFVRNGPEIPERLLQLHEEGRVVFFCGAGISNPAGLPGFADLVDELYATLAVAPNATQKAAIKAGQFDTAIGLLEAHVVGGRETVRQVLAGILSPDLSARRNATATHEALLMLGKSREGSTRLITTNFDRLFEEVIAVKALTIERFQAPLLPVPKNRWDGLVYLHGLLGAAPTQSQLDRLVVSSGDFGLAYLTERWAARFVSQLFRNYTVCFVGYSINDPVLRYMMDALAADRLLGESPPEMFAFGSFSKGKEEARANDWRTKNVTPILYREHNRHAYLHKTLHAWAETYRDGVRGKERIVVEYAIARPLASTRQDDFVGRLLWAMSDPGGLPAKRFAELDPVPSLDWLEPFSEERYQHADLERFGIPPIATVDDKLSFSLSRRPSPYSLAPWMCIVDEGGRSSQWDDVMLHLARWLVRHLDDPSLLLWLVKRGAQLHEDLVWRIEHRLGKLAKLEREGSTVELARIRRTAPKAIPGPLMCTLWRLLLTGRVKSWLRDFDLNRWCNRFKRDDLTATLRLELREILTPRVSLREPFRWPAEEGESAEPGRMEDLVEWEIVLSTDHVHSGLRELSQDERWTSALPELLSDFSSLLRDALDLMRELGSADDRSDLSYMHQPSISDLAPLRDPTREWLKDEISFHLDGLFACMIGHLPQRGSNFPFPRIVRNDDNRASNSHDAEYRSVVARFFQEFAKFFAADSRSEFKPGGIPDNVQSERLHRNYDFIKQQVDLALCRVDEDETNYTLDFERTGLDRFDSAGVRPLFDKLPSSDAASAQQSDQFANRVLADVGNTPEVAPLVRLIAFSSYVTSCVVLTRVETDDDRYAFDIFDALNTTGEPLTAIETFRPRVIQYENDVHGFRDSESERHLNALADHLDRVYADTETRQKETKELLISLALYLNGDKLGLSLAAQRTYLRNVFDGYSRDEHGLAQRRRLVKSIADLAEFRFNYWDPNRIHALDGFHRSPQLADQLKLCFSFLKAMGTSLTLPILARYWVSWRSGDLPEAELLEAARAITAYVVLRRAVTGGTAGIDSELRRLMHPNPTAGGGPFCAGVNRHNNLAPVATLKTELRDRYLKKPCDAQDRNAWVRSASAVPLARRSRPLCRFLLLAAAHNALPDDKATGLLTRTSVRRSENLDYLSFRRWVSHLYATVEHVAPDSDRGAAWDPTIYADDIRHSLGNLILLPHTENTKIGNAEWSKKKLFYRALTAKTQDEKDVVMAQAQKQGLDFGKKTRQLFADNEQLAILESLDAVDTWDRSFIQVRSQRLLELAWDEIWSWLAPN